MPRSEGFIFLALPIPFWTLGDFFGFFCWIWGLRPQITLGSPLWDQVRPHSITKIGGKFYPTPTTPSWTWPPSHAWWGFLGTSPKVCPSLKEKRYHVENIAMGKRRVYGCNRTKLRKEKIKTWNTKLLRNTCERERCSKEEEDFLPSPLYSPLHLLQPYISHTFTFTSFYR